MLKPIIRLRVMDQFSLIELKAEEGNIDRNVCINVCVCVFLWGVDRTAQVSANTLV